MNKEYDIFNHEKEAMRVLQQWVDIVNTCFEDDNSSFNMDTLGEGLDTLESMLLIYNVFAVTKCELIFNEVTATYELEYFE